MRLIDGDELLTAFPVDDEPMLTKSCVRMTIQRMPAVDAVPARHGKWEWDGEAFVCSACGSGYEGQPTMMGEPMFEFCPVCGADMRKDGEHDG